MATPESIGTAACADCGREVFVRENRGGFPYYRCECCGVEHRHHIASAAAKFKREKVKIHAAEPPEKPAKTEAKAAPVKPPEPMPKPAPAVPKKSVFATLMGGDHG